MTAKAFWKNDSFTAHVLHVQEISGTCLDTKPRGIKASDSVCVCEHTQ